MKVYLEELRTHRDYLLWMGSLCAVLAAGAVASAVRFLGQEEVMGATNLVPLGILISTYVFFVVTSTGLCFVTSFGHVFGFHRFEIIARRGVFLSILTLLAGFLAIGVETERPWRLGSLFLVSPGFTAPIWWMAFFYTLYLICLVVELCGLFSRKLVLARYAGLFGFLTAIAAHSTLGAIFGLIKAKSFWEGPYLPIYFILSALVSGTAFLNHTIDALLSYRRPGALVVVLGPTTPLSPVLFAHGVDVVSGARVVAPEIALPYVSEGKSFREMPGVRLLTMQHPDKTK